MEYLCILLLWTPIVTSNLVTLWLRCACWSTKSVYRFLYFLFFYFISSNSILSRWAWYYTHIYIIYTYYTQARTAPPPGKSSGRSSCNFRTLTKCCFTLGFIRDFNKTPEIMHNIPAGRWRIVQPVHLLQRGAPRSRSPLRTIDAYYLFCLVVYF